MYVDKNLKDAIIRYAKADMSVEELLLLKRHLDHCQEAIDYNIALKTGRNQAIACNLIEEFFNRFVNERDARSAKKLKTCGFM